MTTEHSRTGRLWAWVPALILGGLLGSQLVVLSQVLEDPGYAIERDYYRKAVSWDAERARERQSQALGWRAMCEVTGLQPRNLHVQLADARGLPVTGAQVRVEAFHNARAGHVLVLTARELAPGRYEAAFDAWRSGAWELRIHAQRGVEVFARVVRLDLSLGEGS
jgi:nitrogen fixation protein FixH